MSGLNDKVNTDITIGKKLFGPVQYRFRFLNRDELRTQNKLHDHDEVLAYLKPYALKDKNIAMATNYPFVLNRKKEIRSKCIDDYKFIVIPNQTLIARAIPKFRQLLLYDKFAHINTAIGVMSKSVHWGSADEDGWNMRRCQSDVSALLTTQRTLVQPKRRGQRQNNYNQLIALLSKSTVQCFVNAAIKFNNAPIINIIYKYLMDRLDALMHAAAELANQTHAVRTRTGKPKLHYFESRGIFNRIPCIICFKSATDWVHSYIDSHVQSFKAWFQFKVRGKLKFQNLLQGKRSLVREVLSPKCKGVRAQISAMPSLKPNQVLMPISKSVMFHSADIQMVDVLDGDNLQSIDLKKHRTTRLLLKRDPSISAASVSAHDEIGFIRSDHILIGLADLDGKHADFDGDTESAFIVHDPIAVDEIDLHLLPKNNLRIYQQLRISFTESHILFMHTRRFADDAFRFAREYNLIREMEIERWWNDNRNVTMLQQLEANFPEYDFRRYVEPTAVILQSVLNYIVQAHSSRDGYNFYNEINEGVLKLAEGRTDTALYDPMLPQFDYVMGDNLLCDTAIRMTMSGARGTPEILFAYAMRLNGIDNTTKITEYYEPLVDRERICDQMTNDMKVMARKAQDVPNNGHINFQSSIGYDTISFANNKLNYNDRVVCNTLDFMQNSVLIPPLVAATLTCCIPLK